MSALTVPFLAPVPEPAPAHPAGREEEPRPAAVTEDTPGTTTASIGPSRKARRETAGHRAIQRLIAAHRDEYTQITREEHASADTDDEILTRANRLIRAGILPDLAEAFARTTWPCGEIAVGVLLEVEDD